MKPSGGGWGQMSCAVELRKLTQHGGDIFPRGLCEELRASWPRGSLSLAGFEIEFTRFLWIFAGPVNHDLFVSVAQTRRFKGLRSACLMALAAHLPFSPVTLGKWLLPNGGTSGFVGMPSAGRSICKYPRQPCATFQISFLFPPSKSFLV